jgi:hypothetical protein
MNISESQILELEKLAGYPFPDWYRLCLAEAWFGDDDCEEIYLDKNNLIKTNLETVALGAWGCKWEKWYWVIGGDGGGGIYFISLKDDGNYGMVFSIDHEDAPSDINDSERIGKYTAKEFKDMITDGRLDFHNDCLKSADDIRNRKWYQFWIPRKIPDWIMKECRKNIRESG